MDYCMTYSYKIVTKTQGVLTGQVTVYDVTMDVRNHILALHCLRVEDTTMVSYREYSAPSALSRIWQAVTKGIKSSHRKV